MVDFIGIGAQKSGTSWVYSCLYEHPEICAPIKELHFFSRPRYQEGIVWYERHFDGCAAKKQTGEFSTSYLYAPEAAERIKEHYPHVKLIAILRHPVERAYSQYRNAIKAGEVGKETTFEAYVAKEPSALEQGRYTVQLARYLKHFPREQLLTLIYEDSKCDPAGFIRRIFEFLAVDPSFTPSLLHREVNVARIPKRVWVDRLMHHVAEALRRSGLDRLVFWVKRSGLTDRIRAANTEAAPDAETKPDMSAYRQYFADDVRALSHLLERDLNAEWGI